MIKTITSLDNAEVKHVVQLHKKKYRDQVQQFIAEGYKACLTLAQSTIKMKALYVTEPAMQLYDISAFPVDPRIITDKVCDKMTASSTPSGVIGIFEIPYHDFEVAAPGIVLAQVQDPGNMGTLLRSAAAFGITNVYCLQTVDPYHPKVIQATAGTLHTLRIFQTEWDMLTNFKTEHMNLCSLVPTGGAHPNTLDKQNTLLVVDNEAHGIPQEWIAASDCKITIPMPGNTESLNAAVAGSLGMYFLLQEK